MLITRETDYAMRILRALSGGTQMTAQTISDLHQVPKPFAYKGLKGLHKAGYKQPPAAGLYRPGRGRRLLPLCRSPSDHPL